MKPTPKLKVRDQAAWRRWLEEHHASHTGVALLLVKKHAWREGMLTYQEALDEALCFGWIDGIVHRVDDDYRSVRFTPRREDSIWSELNKKHVARLIREKRMTRAGLRLVELAKKSGEWAAARRREQLVEPRDLTRALAANADALAFWRALAPSHRKQWLYWVTEAKKLQTRERRVAAVVKECASRRKPGMKTPST